MKLVVNGETREVPDRMTVRQLLEHLKVPAGRVAVEVNLEVGPRSRFEQHKLSDQPIEEGCDCYACRHFGRGYIRHLFGVEEMLGPILASIHNIRFFQRFMARIRELIERDSLAEIDSEFLIAAG